MLVVSTDKARSCGGLAHCAWRSVASGGARGVDDGILFLIARDDRRASRWGRGLGGRCRYRYKRIVADVVAPRLRGGDFAGGIEAQVGGHCSWIAGEALPPPCGRPTTSGEIGFEEMLVLGIIVTIVVGGVLQFSGRLIAGLASALLFGAWTHTRMLAIGLVGGVLAFVFVLLQWAQERYPGVGGVPWFGGGAGGGFDDGGGGWSGGGGGLVEEVRDL